MKTTSKIFSVAIILFSHERFQENHFGASTEEKILSFTFENQVGSKLVNLENRRIAIMVSAEAQHSSLRPKPKSIRKLIN
jgi:hypothetical protein